MSLPWILESAADLLERAAPEPLVQRAIPRRARSSHHWWYRLVSWSSRRDYELEAMDGDPE
jgi:hypothetical protein